jgi:RHS repeat-associated protein
VVIDDVKRRNSPSLFDFRANPIAVNNFYPFGMMQEGRSVNTSGYRYGFNGMEMDNEVNGTENSYDFGARMYDPRVGRFYSIDPLVRNFPYRSNYTFAADNPVLYIDKDGKSEYKSNVVDIVIKPYLQTIHEVALENNIDPVLIGITLYRENYQLYYSDDVSNFWSNIYTNSKSVLAQIKEGIVSETYRKTFCTLEGTQDQWSTGIIQLQVRHAIRLEKGMSLEEYNSYKEELLNTEEGKMEFQGLYDQAVKNLNDPEKAIEILGKYLGELTEAHPDATVEELYRGYMNSPSNINNEKYSTKEKYNLEIISNAKSEIIEVISDEEKEE